MVLEQGIILLNYIYPTFHELSSTNDNNKHHIRYFGNLGIIFFVGLCQCFFALVSHTKAQDNKNTQITKNTEYSIVIINFIGDLSSPSP
jgi:hypothetical protein